MDRRGESCSPISLLPRKDVLVDMRRVAEDDEADVAHVLLRAALHSRGR